MKLVQSTWFNQYDLIKGNWPDEKFALFSIALSHHLLKEQGLPTYLNTNYVGFDIVINRLGLLYDKVEICLEKDRLIEGTGDFFERYWSLHKLYAYSLQEEPFIHIDNDVYFFKKLDYSWRSAELVAQNQERGLPYYTTCLEEIQQHFTHIPEYLNIFPKSAMAINAGIVGGTNYGFFKQLFQQVIGFLRDNEAHLDKLTEGYGNIFIEQCMMKNYADSLGLQFQYVLPNTIGPSKEYRVNRFHLLPHKADYIHVMNYKSNPTICESIARMLYFSDRNLYHHCIHVAQSINGSQQPLRRRKNSEHLNERSASLEYFFRRTAQIYTLLSGAPLRFISIETIGEDIYLIRKSVPNLSFEVLQDVFVFEFDRYQFFVSMDPDIVSIVYQNFVKCQTIAIKDNWESCYITQAKTVKFIESNWNWVEGNEFRELSVNHYLNNITMPPSYHATIIHYYPEFHIPKEHSIGLCDTMIVKNTTESVLFNDLISFVCESVVVQTGTVLSTDFIDERIRFLTFQGVLVLGNSN